MRGFLCTTYELDLRFVETQRVLLFADSILAITNACRNRKPQFVYRKFPGCRFCYIVLLYE
jgi:hypothetical protein